MASREENVAELRRLLMQGPADQATILAALQVSQPTFFRLWPDLGDRVALGAGRTRRYALRRPIPDVDAPIPVFGISEQGQAAQIGLLQPLQGGWHAFMENDGNKYTLYHGLPFFLRDLRPQGFLGRTEPLRNRDLELPDDILRWTDDHVIKFLARRSEHAPGNIIIGNESYARRIASLRVDEGAVISEEARAANYPRLAEGAMQGDPPGSSAGGEQPKFTHIVHRSDVAGDVEHVLVKFSPKVDSAGGRRWADLLVCEHLALEVLRKNNIAAARTSILEFEQRVFLEVVRFDRHGRSGRSSMMTFAGLDGDLGMADESWTAVARKLAQQGQLSLADQQTVEILDLYGALIGNSDKHHGNLAVSWQFNKPHRLLPSYDMLPMFYRPNTHGEVVPRQWKPHIARYLELRHLHACFRIAQQFWHDVLLDERISEGFKRIAKDHVVEMDQLNPDPAWQTKADEDDANRPGLRQRSLE